MSKPWVGILTALILCSAGGSQVAQAQTLYGNIYQPAVSPYLNITRGGAPAAVNYFGIVQPQLQFNSAINQLQVQQQGIAGTVLGDGSTTGHPVQFNNYSHFYPQRGVGIAGLGSRALPTSQIANPQNAIAQYGNQQNTAKSPLGTAPTPFPKPR